MKIDIPMITGKSVFALAAGLAAALLLVASANVCYAQTLPPGVQTSSSSRRRASRMR